MRTGRRFISVFVFSLLLGAAPAQGATLSYISFAPGPSCGVGLRYEADPGEYNQVHFAGGSARTPVEEPGATIPHVCPLTQVSQVLVREVYAPLNGPCTALTPTTQACGGIGPRRGIYQVFINLGDKDNIATIDLSIHTFVNGGPEHDDISVADGTSDHVRCGAGPDQVVADPLDTVEDDCERVVVEAQ